MQIQLRISELLAQSRPFLDWFFSFTNHSKSKISKMFLEVSIPTQMAKSGFETTHQVGFEFKGL